VNGLNGLNGLNGMTVEPRSRAALRALLRAGPRHLLRAVASGVAAYCAAGALTGATGTAAAVIGAVLGVAGGEVAARRRVRLWFVAVAALLAALAGAWLGGAAMTYELIPDLLGPAGALRFAEVARFGVAALAVAVALRAAGRRVPAFAIVELVATVAAFAIPFAAHRDGVLVRPLWLSDWAWHKGLDPALVLLVLGAIVAGALALLLILESDRRAGPASYIALPGLAALLAVLISVSPPPPPRPANDLGLTQEAHGDPPLPSTAQGDATNPGGGSSKQPQGQQGQQQGQQQQGQQGQQSQGQQQQGQQQQGQQGQQQQQGQQGQQQQQGQQGQQGQQQQQGQQGQQQQQQQQGQGQSTSPPSEPNLNEQSQGNGSAPMAVVLLGDDYTPTSQMYYFRQEAWSDYAGSRLIPARQRDRDADLPSELASGTLPPAVPTGTPGSQTLRADVALLVQHRRLFFLGAPTHWEPLTNPDPSRFVRAYRFETVVSTLDFPDLLGREAGAAEWSDELRSYYLHPPDDPRFARLAKKIVDALPEARRADPFVRAAAIKHYLDENSTYSTAHRHAGVADPTADFLFGDRIGYCVHFAHAAVYLWRAAGIPARIGVGYAVQADNLRGSSILIRGGDAHAWPELYLRGVGWTVLDISPKQNLDPPGTPADDDLQERLAELARGADPDTTPVEPETRRDPPRSIAGPLGITASMLVAAALLALYAVKLWRRIAPSLAGPSDLPRVGYRLALDLLAESGRSRQTGETRERFADRVALDVPAFRRVTDLHLAARFAPPPAPAESRAEWRRLLRGVRRELATSSSPWRRLARALNPISFFAAR
jgi:protein-glutamine gamma-glutamyltransferase